MKNKEQLSSSDGWTNKATDGRRLVSARRPESENVSAFCSNDKVT